MDLLIATDENLRILGGSSLYFREMEGYTDSSKRCHETEDPASNTMSSCASYLAQLGEVGIGLQGTQIRVKGTHDTTYYILLLYLGSSPVSSSC